MLDDDRKSKKENRRRRYQKSEPLLGQTKGLLRRFGLRARKGLGQHFLIDDSVPGLIVSAAELAPNDVVIEVGPGLGVLTRELAKQAGRVIAIELDDKLAAANSNNHNRRGQNVLFIDGNARFVKRRYVDDVSKDDIFTLQNTSVYKGIEVPSCQTDAFLAP